MLDMIISVLIEQSPVILPMVGLPLIYVIVKGDDGYDYDYDNSETTENS